MSNVPITFGSGQASIAGDTVGSTTYQQIKISDGTIGGTTGLIVNSDGTLNARISGSVLSAGGTFNGSVSGTVGASIIGTAPVTQAGTWIASVFGNVSVIGTVPVTQSTSPWIITGSVQGTSAANQSVSGTIGASILGWVPIQPSNTSTIGIFQNSSILAVPVGSVITVIQNASIAGTYAEDAAHTSGDRGIFSLNVRNDTLASVTSTDGDYSALALGPAGEVVTANAPFTKWVRGTADLRGSSGGSVTAIAAQGASVFTYITGIQIANMGSASVLVTLGGGLGSILGYSIAPAGGGSNILYPNALKTGENSAFTASISGVASVLVSAQGFISKT